jgi:hypothetical protein
VLLGGAVVLPIGFSSAKQVQIDKNITMKIPAAAAGIMNL